MTKIQKLGSLSRRIMLLALDAAFINIAFVLALQFRFGMRYTSRYDYYIGLYAEYGWMILTAGCIGCLALCRLYGSPRAGADEPTRFVLGAGLGMGLMMAVNEFLFRADVISRLFPRTVFPVAALLMILFAGGLRLMLLGWSRLQRAEYLDRSESSSGDKTE